MHNYLQIFISLFAMANPLLVISMYLSITKNLGNAQKRMVAAVCGITTFVILTLCLLVGHVILDVLDIHIYALQLGGGMIILLIGITIVLKPPQDMSKNDVNYIQPNHTSLLSLGVSPLAIPMVAGPGVIFLVILYGETTTNLVSKFFIIGTILLFSITIFIFFLLAEIISKVMGDIGVTVLNKLMGLLLTAIAFEMIIGGLKKAIPIIIGTTVIS